MYTYYQENVFMRFSKNKISIYAYCEGGIPYLQNTKIYSKDL